MYSQYLLPIAVAAVSLSAIISFLLGVLQNPSGFWNQLIISGINIIEPVFPSTPDYLKIGFLLESFLDSVPLVRFLGERIVYSTIDGVSQIFALFAVIQIYKLLPFKFS